MKEAKQTILTPLVSLDTPGKATVEVVILADPVRHFTAHTHSTHTHTHCGSIVISSCCAVQDGHEICFVGDEAFRELSQVDPEADHLIDKVMEVLIAPTTGYKNIQ